MHKSFEEILIEHGFANEEAGFVISRIMQFEHEDRETLVMMLRKNPTLMPIFKKLLFAKVKYLKDNSIQTKQDFLSIEEEMLNRVLR